MTTTQANGPAPPPSGELDRIDMSIMRILAADARISLTALADRVGLSRTPVQARVRNLEEAGFITGYRAQISPMKLGLDHVTFVQVRLGNTRETALEAFNQAVLGIPEIEECHMIAGGFDYLLKVRTRDIRDYRRVLSTAVSTLPHVAATSTFVVMEAVKDAGVAALPAPGAR